jgi:hemolysin III
MYEGERFNSWTHLMGMVLAPASAAVLIARAMHFSADAWAIASCAIFAASMLCVYASSTLYHSTRGLRKRLWQRADHCAIYLLIAGTYTPLCLIPLRDDWGLSLLCGIWALAILGIARELAGSKLDTPALPLYLCMGWLGALAALPIQQNLETAAIAWLLGGAMLYTVGTVFFVNDTRWRHAHGIWHLFVLAGSLCHVIMVWHFMASSAH